MREKVLQVRAFAHRKDQRSDALTQMGAEVVFGAFDDFASVKAALKGIRRAYFCYPISKGLVQATAQLGQAAKQSGVEVIVNMSQKIAQEDAASHASFEHWLSERVLDWMGLDITYLRPPFFSEWMLYMAPMIKKGEVYSPFEARRTAFITAEDQGRVVAAILENPAPHKGKTNAICGPEKLSFQKQPQRRAVPLESRSPITSYHFHVIRDNFTSGGVQCGQNNSMSGYAESNQPDGSGEPHIFQHLQAAHHDFEKGLFRGMNEDVERITGIPPMSMEQFIAANRVIFS